MAIGAANHRQKRQKSGRGSFSCAALCLLFGGLVAVMPTFVHAQIEDPFAAQGLWLNVQEYNAAAPAKEEPPVPDTKQVDDKNNQQEAIHRDTKGKDLEPAPPERPLNYPAMPSSGSATPVAVSSTADDEAPVLEEKKDWKGVEEARQEEQKQTEADKLKENAEDNAFSIRFPTLPGRSVKSIPADRVTKSITDRDTKSYLQNKKAETPVKKKEEANNACEALTEYRKRQLDDIESDRRTLAQLKAALSELGLTDRLSFMTSSQGLLSQPVSSSPEKPSTP